MWVRGVSSRPKFDFYDGFRGLSHSNNKARQSVSLPGPFTC